MDGLMMNMPLTVQSKLERARRFFPKKEIITRQAEGTHRYTYAQFCERVDRLASALTKMGVKPGDRIATFAWNTYRHLELYLAVPCIGAVLHTLNIRLAADQLAYIVNHAEDTTIFFDPSLLPAVKQFLPHVKTVKNLVVLCDQPINDGELHALAYEKLLEEGDANFRYPKIEENMAAGLCYTSGTTGNPKGVLYSHRSLYLHSIAITMADSLALSERDVVMPIVPMFHANAWGFPFAATMVGATQVFPAHFMMPRDIAQLIERERITLTAGVPTIWLGIMGLMEQEKFDLSSLRNIIIGGSAVPVSMIKYFDEKVGIPVLQAWGMTETSPLGSVSRLKSYMSSLPEDQRIAVRAKQGLPCCGVEIRAINDEGQEVPWDGQTMGELQVRGPWVAAAYYNTEERAEAFRDGWFSTGDVVTIDAEGYIMIADRTKDLIKSGGEWISSVDLENALLGHPKVKEACVIAVAHEKWVERPLACIVSKTGEKIDKAEIIDYLKNRFASWWLPDDVVCVEEIPKTSVGKFDKKRLREQFKEYRLSS